MLVSIIIVTGFAFEMAIGHSCGSGDSLPRNGKALSAHSNFHLVAYSCVGYCGSSPQSFSGILVCGCFPFKYTQLSPVEVCKIVGACEKNSSFLISFFLLPQCVVRRDSFLSVLSVVF